MAICPSSVVNRTDRVCVGVIHRIGGNMSAMLPLVSVHETSYEEAITEVDDERSDCVDVHSLY